MQSRSRRARANISDVARLAGVSVASVSRVLNQTEIVGEATRAKVLEAVRSLDFSIDQRARGLSRRRSATLGVVVADVSNPFTGQVLKAIDAAARRAGYGLLLGDSGEDVERERSTLAAMLAQRIEGVIYLPVTMNGDAVRPLISQGVPVVCLDRYIEDIEIDAVVVDNALAGAMAADFFIEAEHVRLGTITAGVTTVGRDRTKGFVEAAARRGIDVAAASIVEGDLTLECGRERTLEILSQPGGPTALFVQNHPMALGALLAVRELGLRVPQDLSVIAFDDPAWAQLLEPALTTIRQPTDELGNAAAEMLLERVTHHHILGARMRVVRPELVVRKSVGPPIGRARASAVAARTRSAPRTP